MNLSGTGLFDAIANFDNEASIDDTGGISPTGTYEFASIFDLGGVFFDWDPKFFFTKIISDKDEMDFFLTKVCNDEWNLAQDSGRSIEDGEKDIIKKFPEYENLIRQYYPNHRKMIKGTLKRNLKKKL